MAWPYSERYSNMTTASFTISAFGDEIAPDLESQLQTLNDLKIPCLELRAAWGQNVLHMSMNGSQRCGRCAMPTA